VQNTAYLCGLVAMHKAFAGDYSPESKHSYLPHLTGLLGGSLADDKLLAMGIKTEFKTKEVGAVLSWGMDVSSTMGDVGAVYGGIKGTHYALNSRVGLGALQKLGLARVAAVPNWSLRVGGRALGVVYAPLAGYSYTANGAFIHEKGNAAVYKSAIGAPLEGAIAGGLVGGPFAPVTAVGGAVLSTGAAVYGSFSALDDVLEDNKRMAIEGGVKRTLRRGEQGWIKGEAEPDNAMTEVAQTYIDKLAKADFMRRVVEMKRRNELGSDFPIYADKWEENWENIDAVMSEVSDYKNGAKYWFGAPLDDLTSSERRGVSAIYDYVFENKEGTQKAAETLYQRSFLIEQRDTDTTTAWQAFWHTEEGGAKILITDEITRLGNEFAAKFEAREKRLKEANPLSTSTIEARRKLVDDEVGFLKSSFPLMVTILQEETSRNRIENATTPTDSRGNDAGESVLMTSTAVGEILGLHQSQNELAAELQELMNDVKDPAFQASFLESINDEYDRETLRRHFAAKEERHILSEEQLNPLLLQAYENMHTKLAEETIELGSAEREPTIDDVRLPKIEVSRPSGDSVPGLVGEAGRE